MSSRVSHEFCAYRRIIFIVYLGASLGIGLAGRKYVGSTAHFLVAGRELATWIGVATLAATEIGTITFIYNSELGYRYALLLSRQPSSRASRMIVGRTGSAFHSRLWSHVS